MMKVIALHYVLYHGVKICDDSKQANDNNNMRTIRAQIDTKLFEALHRAEKTVYKELHRLIFKSSGQLTRDAIVPVCLTFWLLIRLQCLRASHLSNLRPKESNGMLEPSQFKQTISYVQLTPEQTPSSRPADMQLLPHHTKTMPLISCSSLSALSSAPAFPSSLTSMINSTRTFLAEMQKWWPLGRN